MVRTRPSVVGVVVIAATLTCSATMSFTTLTSLRGDPTGDGWHVTATGTTSTSTSAPPSTGPEPVFWPELITHTGLELATSCIEVQTLHPSASSYAVILQEAETAWARLGNLPRCDATGPSPSAIVALWTSTLAATLTPPRASVWPHQGIVGLPLELSVLGPTSRTFTTTTPAGPLVIRANGVLTAQLGSEAITATSGDLTLVPSEAGTLRLRPSETWHAVASLGATQLVLPAVTIVGPPQLVTIDELHAELRSLS